MTPHRALRLFGYLLLCTTPLFVWLFQSPAAAPVSLRLSASTLLRAWLLKAFR